MNVCCVFYVVFCFLILHDYLMCKLLNIYLSLMYVFFCYILVGGAKILQFASSQEASDAKTRTTRDLRTYNYNKGRSVRNGGDLVKIVIIYTKLKKISIRYINIKW